LILAGRLNSLFPIVATRRMGPGLRRDDLQRMRVSLGCRTALLFANQQMGHLIRFG
jgi:hypothetical protein